MNKKIKIIAVFYSIICPICQDHEIEVMEKKNPDGSTTKIIKHDKEKNEYIIKNTRPV